MNTKKSSFVKKIFISLILISFVSIILFGLYYYYKPEKELDNILPDGLSQDTAKLLQETNYFYSENLFEIKSTPTMEYFRQRMIYHKYSSNVNLESSVIQELEQEFPGEKGRIFGQLFKLYFIYTKREDRVKMDKKLDTYQKFLTIENLRKDYFGQILSAKFFPVSDLYIVEKFFAYSERYNELHKYDDARSKRIHLEKARAEIYGDRLKELKAKEPYSKQLELEIKIMERELSILSKEEKEQRIQEIKDNL